MPVGGDRVAERAVAGKRWILLPANGQRAGPRIENASTIASSGHWHEVAGFASRRQLLAMTCPSSWPNLVGELRPILLADVDDDPGDVDRVGMQPDCGRPKGVFVDPKALRLTVGHEAHPSRHACRMRSTTSLAAPSSPRQSRGLYDVDRSKR